MKVIPAFLPYAGCVSHCIYCNQPLVTGQKKIRSPKELSIFFKKAIKTINEPFIIGFYSGSFLNLSIETIFNYIDIIPKSKNFMGVRFSTTFESIERTKIKKILERTKIFDIEFGLESLDNDVLKIIGRGEEKEEDGNTIDNEQWTMDNEKKKKEVTLSLNNDRSPENSIAKGNGFKGSEENTLKITKAVKICREFGIPFYIHLMTGLPADNEEKYRNTCRFVAKLKPSGVRIHPTIVLKNTKLEDLYKTGKYEPQSLDEAADEIARSVDIFKKQGIKIIRLGLFPDVSLQKEGSVIAGPFHPAFGSIVYSRYYRMKLIKRFKERGNYTVYCPNKIKSYIIGFKKENQIYFKKLGITYNIKEEKRLMIVK